LAAMCFECRAQKDNVLQPKGGVTVSEGETVTLDCHYNTSQSSPYLFWYRQAADDKPTFILSRFTFGSGNTADGLEERFDSSLDSSSRSVPLKIQSLQLSDSAVYYCALRPTVTGNCKTYYKNLWSVYQESRENATINLIHCESAVTMTPCCTLTLTIQADKQTHTFTITSRHSSSLEEEINPMTLSVQSVEGAKVILSCIYTGSPYNLQWYRQSPGSTAQFLLSASPSSQQSVVRGQPEDLRLSISFNGEQKRVDLEMSSAALAAMCFECRAQKDNVLQPKGGVTVSEGETVTLDCHYNTSGTSAYLFWYRQAADDKPTFILSRSTFGSGDTADGFKERFDSSLDSSSRSVPLKIQSLQLSDSAVYYCALR
ncbi:uncharacterized protein LOC130124489, partial [Lampris incognitus]|uniref:uncharacterized protein LOC130124489 n=1 Tax=Lampris incognitus TaxID=2546036 RepID=UPI0024B59198